MWGQNTAYCDVGANRGSSRIPAACRFGVRLVTAAGLTEAGGLATDAGKVALQIADFLVRTENERLSLLRLHLQATVCKASPLLLDLAVMEGVSISAAIALIHPPQNWPWSPLSDAVPAMVGRFHQRKCWLGASGKQDVLRFRRAFANPGVVIRDADHPRGRFGIRPCGSVLGFTAAIGPCLVSAFGSSALLKLPQQLPETLMMALPGRPLERIIDHPAFAGRDYKVIRVQPDLIDGMPILVFRARLTPFAMQWPEAGA
jgi:hypothetical protein